MANQSVMIATPNTGTLIEAYTASLFNSANALRNAGIASQCHFSRVSLITTGRNAIAAAFIASKHTDLVFIDSDMGWKGPDLVRLLSHDVDVVGGLYKQKTPKAKYNIRTIAGAVANEAGLVPVSGIGAGFLRIRRQAFDMLAAPCPYGEFFDQIRDGPSLFGEDFSFCMRWTATGGTVWADTKIKLQHWGMTAYE